MKNKFKLTLTATILLSSLIIFNLSCKKDNTIEEEQIVITADKTNPLPYEIITITVTGQDLLHEEYSGTLGDISIRAIKTEDTKLMFMLPFLEENSYTLSIDIEGKDASLDLSVKEQEIINNYGEVITDMQTGITNVVSVNS